MGVDIHIHICKYNPEDNFYHELSLYRPRDEDEKYNYDKEGNKILVKDKYIRISPYDARNSEMFDGMTHGDTENGYGCFPAYSIAFNSLEPNFREEIKKKTKILGFYDFNEISFADFKNYLNEHPTVVDYDSDEWETWKNTEPKPQKKNPLNDLFDYCVNYANFAEKYGMFAPYSQYKILFWFDN